MVYANWSCLVPRNPLEPSLGTHTLNPYLESRNPLEPLCRTLTWNFRNLTCTWNPFLEPWLGTLTWEPCNLFNLYFGTWEPLGTLRNLEPSFTWNPYLEPGNLLDPWLATLAWNLGTSRNLAGWLPQSVPGPSLAETPKLSAVGDKTLRSLAKHQNTSRATAGRTKTYPMTLFKPENWSQATKAMAEGATSILKGTWCVHGVRQTPSKKNRASSKQLPVTIKESLVEVFDDFNNKSW